jgi:transposase
LKIWQDGLPLRICSGSAGRSLTAFFPVSRGVPRGGDNRVVSGIVFVIKNRLRWRDALKEDGPIRPFTALHSPEPHGSVRPHFRKSCPATRRARPAHHRFHSHRTAASLLKKGCSQVSWAHEGRIELETARRRQPGWQDPDFASGQMSDHEGAQLMLPALPHAKSLPGIRARIAMLPQGADRQGHRALHPAKKRRTAR